MSSYYETRFKEADEQLTARTYALIDALCTMKHVLRWSGNLRDNEREALEHSIEKVYEVMPHLRPAN